MMKIWIAILLLLVPITLEHKMAIDHFRSPAPADYITIVTSFLDTIGFQKEAPLTCVCVDESLPIVVPEIIDLIKKVQQIKTVEELIVILIDVYTRFPDIIKQVIENCQQVPAEVKGVIAKIIDIVKKPDFISNTIAKAKAHLPEIIMNARAFSMMIEDGNYKQAGKNLGEIFTMLFY